MPEALGITEICGQAVRILGDHVVARREPGGADAGHELPEEVSYHSCGVVFVVAWELLSFRPSDLEHPNQYVVGLALCTLGNIASQEMARDLFQEVESLLSTANPYIQRKAALCTMRIIRKVPDLQEHFVNKTKPLLQDRKNHAVLLCGITLVTDMCLHNPELIPQYVPYVPVLVQHLKKLTSSGYAPEHDVTGITDPFLQVKILRLLRILGKHNPEVSEQINDILTQVRSARIFRCER
jgi:AP-1 complex subunit gamma-1